MLQASVLFILLLMTAPLAAQSIDPALSTHLDESSSAFIIAVLDPECPISQKYTRTLNDLASAYEKRGVTVWGIVSVRNIRQVEIDSFSVHYQLQFRCLPDAKLNVAASLEASVTPEVFLLDKDHNVVYSGAIDDWFFDLGRSKRKPTTHFLADAIENYLRGEPLKIKWTEPVGCRISYQKPRPE